MQKYENELNLIDQLVENYTGILIKRILPFTAENFINMTESDLIVDITPFVFIDEDKTDFLVSVVNEVYYDSNNNYFGYKLGQILSGELKEKQTVTYDFHSEAAVGALNIQDIKKEDGLMYIFKVHGHLPKKILTVKATDEFVLNRLNQFNS